MGLAPITYYNIVHQVTSDMQSLVWGEPELTILVQLLLERVCIDVMMEMAITYNEWL